MPLEKPHPRKHIHTRDIQCLGYQRDDGLWDIEGTIMDTKTYSFDNIDRGGVDLCFRRAVASRSRTRGRDPVGSLSPFYRENNELSASVSGSHTRDDSGHGVCAL